MRFISGLIMVVLVRIVNLSFAGRQKSGQISTLCVNRVSLIVRFGCQ